MLEQLLFILYAIPFEEMGNKITGLEKWEDGNITPGDGWDQNWNIELGMTCTGGSISSKDIWIAICGDGIRIK